MQNKTVFTATEARQNFFQFIKLAESGRNVFIKKRGEIFKIKISNQLLTIVTTLISIDKELLLNFLKLIKKNIHHKNIESRDFLHIATCLQYKISTLIT